MKRTPQLIALSLTLLLLTSCATPGEPFGSPGGVGTEITADGPHPAENDSLIRISVSGRPSAIPYEGTAVTDELWDLIVEINRFSSFERQLAEGKDTIEIDYLTLLFFPYDDAPLHNKALFVSNDSKKKKTEHQDLYEKYEYLYDDFIEISLADDCFNRIFSKRAEKILPVYKNGENCVENGTLIGFEATGVDVHYVLILRSMSISDEVIEMSFSTIIPPMVPRPYTIGGTYLGETEITGYVFREHELDQLRIVKYTFVLEDGTYKILSIELTKE